jgi:hypothetical protein
MPKESEAYDAAAQQHCEGVPLLRQGMLVTGGNAMNAKVSSAPGGTGTTTANSFTGSAADPSKIR